MENLPKCMEARSIGGREKPGKLETGMASPAIVIQLGRICRRFPRNGTLLPRIRRRSGVIEARNFFSILEATPSMMRKRYYHVILSARLALLGIIRYSARTPLLQVYAMIIASCCLSPRSLTIRKDYVIKYAIV